MTSNQRISILIGAAILIAMLLFPPWIHDTPERNYYNNSGVSHMIRRSAGYYFLFDTHQQDTGTVHRIDFGRLFIQSVVVSAITAFAFVALRPSNPQ